MVFGGNESRENDGERGGLGFGKLKDDGVFGLFLRGFFGVWRVRHLKGTFPPRS